jgi:uncharacterized protein YndB with AHSA1/START domain
MKTILLLAATAVVFAQGPVKMTKLAAPEKALIFEVLVPAKPADVWKAFSTSDGLSTWLTPGAVVDLRKGGEWTAHFPGGSTGGGTIKSYVPEKEMTIAALCPEQFPNVRRERTNAKFEFVPADNGTLVRLTQTGWKTGEEWDKAYDYLTQGNAQLMEILQRRFTSGPIDWAREWK